MPAHGRRIFGAGKRLAIAIAAVLAVLLVTGFAMRSVDPFDWFAHSSAGHDDDVHAAADSHEHPHEHHHEHPGHVETAAIELSPQAQRNIGLRLMKIEPRPFERTITVPAVIVERPGRSEVAVTAALSGIVDKIYPLEGQAVVPGESLFELRLTHEELVQAQTEFLRSAEELDIVNREIARLEPLAEKGAIAIKTIIDRRYEREKLLAVQRAQREGLLLHGLSAEQIDGILKRRRLLQSLTIRVPQGRDETAKTGPREPIYQVQKLQVERGQYVEAGQQLCVLTDHAELYIEGKAFEQDAGALNQVAEKHWPVTALLDSEGERPAPITGLKLLYVASKVEAESRTLRFFVRLPNVVLRDGPTPEGQRFITWKFKPGQRLQLQVPVAVWPDRIVLPDDAVIQEGAESFVFQQNGDHFDRRPVHVEYRDATSVVVANDGSLYPGDTVVASGAQQLHLALKNKAGGGIDPHAGHNH